MPSQTTPIDPSAERWLLKQAYKNYWKVPSWYDLDDLIADGYSCWYMVVDRYSESAKERVLAQNKKPKLTMDEAVLEVLMSLFTRTFTNHIYDLAQRRTACLEDTLSNLVSDDALEATFLDKALSQNAVCDVYSRSMISEAPGGIREVLQAYADAAPAVLSAYRRRNGVRESMNERMCRIAGKDPEEVDMVSMVRAYLERYKGLYSENKAY